MRCAVAVLLLILAVFAPFARGAHAQGASWALVIGIDKYESDDVAPLQCASADARAMAQTLKQSCAFAADHVILMTSDATGRDRPTSANVLRWLEGLKSVVKRGDTFLFYFSGHGVAQDGESFLITMDTSVMSQTLLRKTSLGVKEVEAGIREIQATRIIQIIDACRNDPRAGRAAADNPLTSTLARDLTLTRSAVAESEFTATLFACQEGQRSYEGHKGHGYFTWHLIKGLSGEAVDSQGQVTLGSLVGYLEKRVPETVQLHEHGRSQVPWARMLGTGAMTWPLAGRGLAPVASSPAPASAASGAYTISVSYPPPGFHSPRPQVYVTGVVVGPDRPTAVQVTVNGRTVGVSADSVQPSARGATVSVPVQLDAGENRIVLAASDAAGRGGRTELVVFHDEGRATTIPSTPPQMPRPSPAVSAPAPGASSPPPVAAHMPPAGSGVAVTIRCAHSNANIWIDQRLVANPPTTVSLAPGDHELRVTLDEDTAPYQRRLQVQAGVPLTIDVELARSAVGLYRDGLEAHKAGDATKAAALFEASLKAPGRHPAEVLFYQALFAYRANRLEDAEKVALSFLNVHDGSCTGHYLLGIIRQKLGNPLATTAYKAAVLRLFREGRALLDGTGPINGALVARLRKAAGSGSPRVRLRLGFALEQRGQLDEARDVYRQLCESMFARFDVRTDHPLPEKVQAPPE